MEFYEIKLVTDPIAPPPFRFPVGAGGVVDFVGVVRPEENGRPLDGLQYSVHPVMGRPQLEKIGAAAAERFPLLGLWLHHRTGLVAAGEASLWVRTACAHRAEAYESNQWLVEELKRKAPIWKNPCYS